MKTIDPVDQDSGLSLTEWIHLLPNELSRDAVGMFQIIPDGRDVFHLSGAEMINFVRLAITALLDSGAVPVRGGAGSGYEWVYQKQYGFMKNDIINSIIAEWLAMPDDPLVLCGEGVWFARPDPDFPKYVKLD
jgi:hypothetical protein